MRKMKIGVAIASGMLMIGCARPAVMQPTSPCTCKEKVEVEKVEASPCWESVKDGAGKAANATTEAARKVYKASKAYLHEATAPDEK